MTVLFGKTTTPATFFLTRIENFFYVLFPYQSSMIKNSQARELRGEREKAGQISSEEIMTENFPNLGEETQVKIQKVQRIQNKRNTNRPWRLSSKESAHTKTLYNHNINS